MSGYIDEPGQRMPSGIRGLDQVLLGGFIRNGIYIVQGPPGSGKTIFANQVCYTHIAAGGRALYLTLLSEQHERMLANIRGLSFFNPSYIARQLNYVSAYQVLERDGLVGLLGLLRREIVSHRASVLIVDGLVAAEEHASSDVALKKFVHELQMLSAASDCTMFLLTSARDALVSPEHTMVDGMIEIGTEASGWRVERSLLVRKFRGSDYLLGRHAFSITGDGIVVWPRVESLPTAPGIAARRVDAPRLSTGIAGLDEMLGGGLPPGSATLVLGPAGAGKTALCLRYLAECSADEPGLMLGFYESPEQLQARAEDVAPALARPSMRCRMASAGGSGMKARSGASSTCCWRTGLKRRATPGANRGMRVASSCMNRNLRGGRTRRITRRHRMGGLHDASNHRLGAGGGRRSADAGGGGD